MCGGPTKAQYILHEFVSQIPLLWNYENCIHAYVKSRETEDHLRIGVKLKLFERKLDFSNSFENWSLENYLKMEFYLFIYFINKIK